MLDVCLLGTGGMMPLPYRWLTSLMMKYNGKSILIDCGEGTQVAMREKGWSAKPIDIICFTHFHADHVSGLPGLLLSMGNSERTEPLLIIGPKGLSRVVNALRVIAPELPFEIEMKEIAGDEEDFAFDGFTIRAFRVNHSVTCYGYSLTVHRAGKFDKERAVAQGIPLKCWNPLQKGQTVTMDGRTYTPDMVMGETRKGLKVTYSTDSRPTKSMEDNAVGSDLLILEGMYGEAENYQKAKENRHMMMQEAARIALKVQAPELWLTHYSPAMPKPELFADEIKGIFPKTVIARDGRSVELRFSDEETSKQ